MIRHQPCLIQASGGSGATGGGRCWQSHQVPPGQAAWCWSRHAGHTMMPFNTTGRRDSGQAYAAILLVTSAMAAAGDPCW